MSWLDGFAHRVRTLLAPGAHERELRDEMRFHEELDAMQQRDAGLARRRFGNRTYYQEETRRITWLGSLDLLRQDAGYALRTIRRSPGFTLTVVAVLSLGIGVNAAMFAFLDTLFLRPPSGVDDPSTLRRLWTTRYSSAVSVSTYENMDYPTYLTLRDVGADAGAHMALYTFDNDLRIGRDQSTPPVHAVYATSSYFDVLRLRPATGRFFAPAEDVMGAGAPVAVISHELWLSRYGGDAAIVGKSIELGRTRYTIVGVMPGAFVGLDLQAADLWIPLASFPGSPTRGKPWYQSYRSYRSRAVMRVPAGFDHAAFAARSTVLARRVAEELGRADPLMTLRAGPIISARGPGAKQQELVIATRLAGVAMIVLVIACANVVNLLLARAVTRGREIAVRLALGVSRFRLIRLLTTETVLLALLGAGGAMLAAWWGGGMLRSLLLPNIAWIDSAFDPRVAAFAVVVALLTGLVTGIVPALQASNPRLSGALKGGSREGTRHRSTLRSLLVVVQTALSVVLLVGAALFVRTLKNVQGIDLGFDRERVMMAEVRFGTSEGPPKATLAAAMRELALRVEKHPEVERVALTYISPMRGYSVQSYFTGPDSLGSSVSSDAGPLFSAVSPGFFAATGLRFLGGTTFTGSDAEPRPEVVLNDVAARLLYPGENALGRCIRFAKRANPCHTVVGIVENANAREVIEKPIGQFYVPLGSPAAVGWGEGTAIVLRADPRAMPVLQAEIKRELRRMFPLGNPYVVTMAESLAGHYQPWRLGATLFTAFGLLALLVALAGIYSTVSYAVGQRTREFGVRIALGAQVRDVLSQVLGEGVRVVAIGVVVGIVLALAAGRLVSSLLFGVEASDPSAMLLASSTLLGVAIVAALVPAWRAARVDPVVALRSD